MKKLVLYASIVALGLASCSKEYYVNEEDMPSWLGSSIYENLKSGSNLDGTFNTYLKLIDDCKYSETLSRTGSKTIFPANDAAFEAFFAGGNNKYGATCYEDLTLLQKQEILYSSMLDNAILIGNISSRKNTAGIMVQGQVVKHETNFKNTSYIENATPWFSQSYPANNPYFSDFSGSIDRAVYDDTNPPMVHFTGEYMLNNDMTLTEGSEPSDFYVLTGNEYTDGAAYVFDKKVIKSDVTCQNGYIHQLDGVLTNPGNMAQIIRNDKNLSLFSRILDYFAVPTTLTTYPGVTSIRYLSKNSQRSKFSQPKIGVDVANARLLNFDPGWNMYNPTITGGSTSDDQEIAAVLAPTDDAVKKYFLSEGKYILANLGAKGLDVNESNLTQHLDSVYTSDPSIFASFLNNVFKAYLSKTVPSKFSTVQNDAFEFMEDDKVDGKMINHILKKADGKYDVTIANNGVIYNMDKFYTPKLYNSVLGPASVYTDLRTMGEMLNDHQITAGTPSALGADMYYYLLSMKARYAVMCPTDDNNSFKIVDPTSAADASLKNDKKLRVLRFRFDGSSNESFHIYVDRLLYDTSKSWNESSSFELLNSVQQNVNISTKGFNTQIKDLLDYCTIVLADSTETDKVTRMGLYGNRFYRTKNGGAIRVDGIGSGAKISGGLQIDNSNIPASTITQVFDANSADAKIENGSVYRLDFPMQPTVTSVYDKLSANPEFYDENADYENNAPEYDHYLNFCERFSSNDDVYVFAGILTGKETTDAAKAAKLKPYKVIGANNAISLFNAYNYTMYLPTYTAMKKAQQTMGLPTWKEVLAIVNDWEAVKDTYGFNNEQEAKNYVKGKLAIMAKFVRYHTHSTSIFADRYFVNTVNIGTEENPVYRTNPTPSYASFASVEGTSNPLKIYVVQGGGDQLTIKDEANNQIKIQASSSSANMLAREISVKEVDGYPTISSSSFVTMHGIDTPLCFNKNNSYK